MEKHVLSRSWVFTDPNELVLYNKFTGDRQEVSEETIKVLSAFAQPRSLKQFVASLDREVRKPVRSFLDGLVEVGILEIESNIQSQSVQLGDSLVQRPARTMFSCPVRELDTLGNPDITFIGSPFDSGVTGYPGAKYAPDKLRDLSSDAFEYHADILTGKSLGWYSHEVDRNILDSVSMADIGNVLHHVGEGFDSYFDRVRSVVGKVRQAGSFPVLVGGDHSVSYAAIGAFSSDGISVLHIDAHTDLGTYIPGIPNNHGNVFTRLRHEGKIASLMQFGVRSFAGVTPRNDDTYAAFSAKQVRKGEYVSFMPELDKDKRYYLSLDIDVLDPTYAPGTGTPVPGGLTTLELTDLLSYLGKHYRFVGCDIVEVNPLLDKNDLTSLTAIEVLLHFLGEAFR